MQKNGKDTTEITGQITEATDKLNTEKQTFFENGKSDPRKVPFTEVLTSATGAVMSLSFAMTSA